MPIHHALPKETDADRSTGRIIFPASKPNLFKGLSR